MHAVQAAKIGQGPSKRVGAPAPASACCPACKSARRRIPGRACSEQGCDALHVFCALTFQWQGRQDPSEEGCKQGCLSTARESQPGKGDDNDLRVQLMFVSHSLGQLAVCRSCRCRRHRGSRPAHRVTGRRQGPVGKARRQMMQWQGAFDLLTAAERHQHMHAERHQHMDNLNLEP